MPDPVKPPKLLELRINSVADAKAIVQHQAEIFSRVKLSKLDGIEFIVAKEVDPLVGQYIDRLFRCNTWKAIVEPKNGNMLGIIPHLLPPKPKLPASPVNNIERFKVNEALIPKSLAVPPVAKRKGRPTNAEIAARKQAQS